MNDDGLVLAGLMRRLVLEGDYTDLWGNDASPEGWWMRIDTALDITAAERDAVHALLDERNAAPSDGSATLST
jgi:hypothetical protein